MAKFQTLPVMTPRADGEDFQSYGVRVLQFVLATEVTATLTDSDLDRGKWAATAALAQRVNLGTKDAPEMSPAVVFDQIEKARGLMTAALDGRKAQVNATLLGFFGAEALAAMPAATAPAALDGAPLTADEVTFIRELRKQLGDGGNGGGGTREPRRPHPQPIAPTGAQARPF